MINLYSLTGSDELILEDKLYYKDLEILANPQVHSTAIKIIERYLKPSSNILEIGAGTGAFTLRIIEKGFSVSASSIDPNSFKLADVPFYYIDMNHELPDGHTGKYDAVVALEVIEHVENIYDFFRKIYRLLKPHSWAFISTPNVMNMRSRLMFMHSGNFTMIHPHVFKEWGHIQVLPPWLLTLAAERGGFTCWEVVGIGRFRKDSFPIWQNILTSIALCFKKLCYKEKFLGEFSSPNLLMILKKQN